jgi:serine/threonine protein phosphatase PrpC
MIHHSISLLGAREKNEDEIDIINNNDINFYGIYDGHGGIEISRYLKENLSKFFIDTNCMNSKFLNKQHIFDIYECIQKKLIEFEIPSKKAGSTALVTLIIHNKIKIINLGDCRAVICNNNNIAIPLTKDHKPSSYDEKKRILEMGGKIKYCNNDDPRINGMAVSRSFGDLDAKPYISHIPDIYDYKIHNDKFIILGCDGVWDVLSNQDAVDYVLNLLDDIKIDKNHNNKNKKNIANLLGNHAISMGSQDNISIIIIFIKI